MANIQMLQQLIYSNNIENYLSATQRNAYVQELQQLLNELGYGEVLQFNTLGADGYYGQTVVNAVGTYCHHNGIPSDGMSVSPHMMQHMLQRANAGQGNTGAGLSGSSSFNRPQTPPASTGGFASAAGRLNLQDMGDRINVSDGSNQASFIKRNAGVVNYGSITLSQAIRANQSLIGSLGITTSALNVMESVSENEGKLDAVNTYDRAFLSFGVFQWTMGTDGGSGELPALLKKLKRSFPTQFQQYFGAYGLDVSSDTSDTSGYLVLNGNRIDSASEKEQFRSADWAYRFWLAGQSSQMQAVEIQHALGRLNKFYWNSSLAINGFTLSKIITSEYGVALLLDNHVNRPNWVQACVQQAMTKTGLYDPSSWTTAEETQVLDAYLRIRATYTTGSASPMTKANERAAVTKKYLYSNVISGERGSFRYSQQMMA